MQLTALSPQVLAILISGLVVFLLLDFQMLLGYRKIKFKGRLHWKVHKSVAWVIALAAAVHALYALWYLGVFRSLL
jgi:hypothetical protein